MGVDALQWWALLRTAAALNVVAWVAVALWWWRRRHEWPGDAGVVRQWQLWLSAGYVAGCAWRSLMPVYDVPRIVMVDSFWSSVLVGRTVATAAELCFAAQWALWLREVARAADDELGMTLSRAVLPLIAVAEMFSWYSVLTTSNAGHVVEESLWGLSAALVVFGLARAWRDVERTRRPLLAAWFVIGGAYALYIFSVDVPMYWARWTLDDVQGRGTLSIAQGFVDASARWVVSHRWEDWRSEVAWMTAYFSVAVWLSIALVATPTFRRRSEVQATSGASMTQRASPALLRRSASVNAR